MKNKLNKKVQAFVVAIIVFHFLPEGRAEELSFALPSTLNLSVAESSTETKSSAVGLRIMLPKNFWVDLAADRATETTDGLQTKTVGGSLSLGTDPLNDFTLEIGAEGFGVKDQYSVGEARLRGVAMPANIFGIKNPGFELALEYRQARFEFQNVSNLVFSGSTVKLPAQTFRTELGIYLLSPWTIRLFFERVNVDPGFAELNRPLAPLFLPETAISTAISWPREEDGLSLSYSSRDWGARIMASRKVAAVTLEKTFSASLSVDYRWSRKISTALRYSNAKSENDSSLPAIDNFGFDFTLSFY